MKNKVVVITGAASGIGLALANACILDGMNVVMADIDEPNLNKQIERLRLSTKTQLIGITCDVSKDEDVSQLAKKTFEHFKRVDLLINNAGVMGHLAPIWQLSSMQVRQVMDVNLYGVLHCIQAFVPLMLEQHHPSHIVNMASFYGLCSGSQMGAYAMSKHAIVALSESLHFDLQRLNKHINISVVCPSFTNTQLLLNSSQYNNNKLHQTIGSLMEHSRPAEDVAECILREVKKKTFYILPDHEIKHDCEERTKAIVGQTKPYEHGLEKILAALCKRHSL